MPSLLEAIEAKYCSQSDDTNTCSNNSYVIFAPIAGPRQQVPCLLILNDCDVDCGGNEAELLKICSRVNEIDLSRNNLKAWSEIGLILRCSPVVTFLNLSFNDLSLSMRKEDIELFPQLPRLKTLILIGTNITWKSVWIFIQKANCLEELHLSLNKFSDIDDSEFITEKMLSVPFDTIQRIMFDGNPISEWSEIVKLGKYFPKLKHLALTDTSIISIADDAHNYFHNLQSLSICNTNISEMDDFVRLNSFPLLKEIRLTGISFCNELTEYERRQRYIALLPNATRINGGAVISTSDRDGAERAFIRYYNNKENPPTRYHELVEIHGKLGPLVDISLKPAKYLNLQIFFGGTCIQRKTKLHQTVSEFKTELEPIVGIHASTMKLHFADVGLGGREIMKFPLKQLYSYNMHDGDEIHVS